MEWEFYSNDFIVDQTQESFRAEFTHGPWSGHRRFAYDLVRFAQPSMLVELGTYCGTSFFSFCQAVKDGGLSTHCYAIDSWNGDPHSGYSHEAGEKVFQFVQNINDHEFSTFATLLRCDFDQALHAFTNESIDLLHIDGYHTYEAVHHDYMTWYPKLSDDGIILFHDICVRTSDFGVYRLWEELTVKENLPHFTFSHSYGLGVLFPKKLPKKFQKVLEQQQAFHDYYSKT